MNLKLLVDVSNVKRDGVNAGSEFGSSRFVCVALNQQLQKACFMRSEMVLGLRGRANGLEQTNDSARHFGRHRRAAGHYVLQTFQQSRGGGLLQQVSRSPRG